MWFLSDWVVAMGYTWIRLGGGTWNRGMRSGEIPAAPPPLLLLKGSRLLHSSLTSLSSLFLGTGRGGAEAVQQKDGTMGASRSDEALVMWTRCGTPVASSRAAILTVLPNTSNMGRSNPRTPVATGPKCIPPRSCTSLVDTTAGPLGRCINVHSDIDSSRK